MSRAGWVIPTSGIFFQPSGETHGGSAVWALHTTRPLSMGLDRGGLALPADGIRFCFAWRGANIHDPQWVERSARSHSQHGPPVFQILSPLHANTVAVKNLLQSGQQPCVGATGLKQFPLKEQQCAGRQLNCHFYSNIQHLQLKTQSTAA